jgi:flagellar hook-associated protein 2
MSSIGSTGSSALNTGGSTGSNTGTTTAAPLTITGLASGINTTAIIQQLVAVQQQQVTNLQNQQTAVTNQETAFQAIESDLLALQSQTTSLSNSINGIFNSLTVTSSNQNIVTGAASANATPGVYSFNVDSLAQAQVIASQGYASSGSTITQGNFSFQVGSGPVTTIAVDGSNNTLQGLASAINNSGGGITASIVNDGSANDPYRLVLTSNSTGTANNIAITNNLAADSGNAALPVFDSTYIGPAFAGSANTSTSIASSNSGAGGYTGSANNTYTFTVVNGGTVGTSNGITLNYSDATGANKGTITLSAADGGVPQSVAQGLQIAFSSGGTLVAGDTFSVNAFVPTVQQATNASVTVGSGAGALTVASPTNQLDDVIPGVTLNLVGADPSQAVSLTVAADTSTIATAIQSFVSAYNTVVAAINSDTSFDSTTSTPGVLLGNSDISSIQGELAQAVGDAVPGLTGVNNLTAIGITTNADGTLSLDSSTLNNVLNGQVPGVSLADVENLFTLSGQANVAGVQFVAGSDQTQASATPYQVVVTQAATQGSITGTAVVSGTIAVTGSTDTLTLAADGGAAQTLTIPSGSYTPAQLTNEIQSLLAANTSLSGVQVSLSGSQLTITSSNYGTSSGISASGGSALALLGFTAGEAGAGQNVAGHFVVQGATEAATGAGQILTGNSGNANTDGLEIQISLTPSQVAANPQIDLTVSRGVASSLGQTLDGLLDPTTGRLQTITQSFQDQIANIQQTITQDNNLITQQENQLTAQFAAMEAIISQLKSESSVIATLAADSSSSSSSSNNSSSAISFPSTSSSSSSS